MEHKLLQNYTIILSDFLKHDQSMNNVECDVKLDATESRSAFQRDHGRARLFGTRNRRDGIRRRGHRQKRTSACADAADEYRFPVSSIIGK